MRIHLHSWPSEPCSRHEFVSWCRQASAPYSWCFPSPPSAKSLDYAAFILQWLLQSALVSSVKDLRHYFNQIKPSFPSLLWGKFIWKAFRELNYISIYPCENKLNGISFTSPKCSLFPLASSNMPCEREKEKDALSCIFYAEISKCTDRLKK